MKQTKFTSKFPNMPRRTSSLGQVTGDIGHDAVDPKILVLQTSVHKVNGQLAVPWLTFNLRQRLHTLHLSHQGSILHVVPE